MNKARGALSVTLVLIFLLGYLGQAEQGRAANGGQTTAPERKTTLSVSYTRYEWWVLRWSDNQILCQLFTDHEGLPTGADILKSCGQATYNEWISTTPCDSGNPSECTGLYLFLVGSQVATKDVLVDLPPATVWITLANCTPSFPENRCSTLPSLVLTGEEPLPNQQITAIHALVNGVPYNCDGTSCTIPLQATPENGIPVEFWADSSFGDSSAHFTAQVRVVETGVSPSPEGRGYYVDVLSSQWRGRQVASCAQTWQSFPPVGGPPLWLTTPEVPELLASDIPYYFLAGRLISQGMVDASSCPGNGVLPNGYADECGLQKALPQVESWQNQFDQRIIDVATKTGVPGQLLKNVFAQESQFWPGIFNSDHLGLGHITDQGAEVILLWNPSFYEQFCSTVLDSKTCTKGYVHLTASQQALLRGALASQAKTDCPSCTGGIDLNTASTSVNLFAETMLANCEQVGQEVYNATRKTPGAVSSYEDLWRFTLANYHAGPGCLSFALYSAASNRDPIDWQHVSTYFTPVCQGVVPYVNNITK